MIVLSFPYSFCHLLSLLKKKSTLGFIAFYLLVNQNDFSVSRSEIPRYHRKDQKCQGRVYFLNRLSHGQMRNNRPRHDKEEARICPFFQDPDARDQYRNHAEYLPGADDGHKVFRIAQIRDDRDIATRLEELLQTAGQHAGCKKNGRNPINDLVCL